MADVETVEKRVAGLAERIIAEDAVKRMEELVSVARGLSPYMFSPVYFLGLFADDGSWSRITGPAKYRAETC